MTRQAHAEEIPEIPKTTRF